MRGETYALGKIFRIYLESSRIFPEMRDKTGRCAQLAALFIDRTILDGTDRRKYNITNYMYIRTPHKGDLFTSGKRNARPALPAERREELLSWQSKDRRIVSTRGR